MRHILQQYYFIILQFLHLLALSGHWVHLISTSLTPNYGSKQQKDDLLNHVPV